MKSRPCGRLGILVVDDSEGPARWLPYAASHRLRRQSRNRWLAPCPRAETHWLGGCLAAGSTGYDVWLGIREALEMVLAVMTSHVQPSDSQKTEEAGFDPRSVELLIQVLRRRTSS